MDKKKNHNLTLRNGAPHLKSRFQASFQIALEYMCENKKKRQRGRAFEPHRRHCIVSLRRHIDPSLVLVQPGKARPYIVERFLMGRKESNEIKNKIIQYFAQLHW